MFHNKFRRNNSYINTVSTWTLVARILINKIKRHLAKLCFDDPLIDIDIQRSFLYYRDFFYDFFFLHFQKNNGCVILERVVELYKLWPVYVYMFKSINRWRKIKLTNKNWGKLTNSYRTWCVEIVSVSIQWQSGIITL